MAVFTVFLTVVVFRYVRAIPNHEIMTPVALVAFDSSSSKNLAMYNNQNFNNHYQVRIKNLLIISKIGASETGLAIANLLHSMQYRIVVFVNPDTNDINLNFIVFYCFFYCFLS